MLFGIEQRARADAAVLAPPDMLPGTTLNPEQDETHARYVWLYVRPSRVPRDRRRVPRDGRRVPRDGPPEWL